MQTTETKSKHTAGPWAKARGGFKGSLDVVGRENGKPVVVAENFRTEADRALFLAAPELLEALKSLVALHGDFAPGKPFEFPPDHPISTARAAIAKATGDK